MRPAWSVIFLTTLLGAGQGLFLALYASGLFGRLAPNLLTAGIVAALTRTAALVRNARLRPRSTLQTAIGIKHPRIEQKAQGAMGGSFNTREFFHGASPARLDAVKWAFLLGAFGVPAVLLLLELHLAAFAVQFAGLLAERWHFFAGARHPQNLYYQAIS